MATLGLHREQATCKPRNCLKWLVVMERLRRYRQHSLIIYIANACCGLGGVSKNCFPTFV